MNLRGYHWDDFILIIIAGIGKKTLATYLFIVTESTFQKTVTQVKDLQNGTYLIIECSGVFTNSSSQTCHEGEQNTIQNADMATRRVGVTDILSSLSRRSGGGAFPKLKGGRRGQ